MGLQQEVPVAVAQYPELLHALIYVEVLAPEAEVQPARAVDAVPPAPRVGLHREAREDLHGPVEAVAVALLAVHDVEAAEAVRHGVQHRAGPRGEEDGVGVQLHRPGEVLVPAIGDDGLPDLDEDPRVQAGHPRAAHGARGVRVDGGGVDAWGQMDDLVAVDCAPITGKYAQSLPVLHLHQPALRRRHHEREAEERGGRHGRQLGHGGGLRPHANWFDVELGLVGPALLEVDAAVAGLPAVKRPGGAPTRAGVDGPLAVSPVPAVLRAEALPRQRRRIPLAELRAGHGRVACGAGQHAIVARQEVDARGLVQRREGLRRRP
mmetsp:Transcript_27629/g.86016  ORF Transcript_27629/g.86016 Transcript_27629/m.86016 type:complete len:321 (+) Transcript_27629:214-1176(+)